MNQSRITEGSFARIQMMHEPQPYSNPYQPEPIENALKQLNLSEAPWSPAYFNSPREEDKERECIVRHETGPEIIISIASVVSLATAIINLVAECKKHRPETRVQITVSSFDDLEKVTEALKKNE